MQSTPPPPLPPPAYWIGEVWDSAIHLLHLEDPRFKEVKFSGRRNDETITVEGPEELVDLLVSPSWKAVIRTFVRRAAGDMNRAETRHALEDPAWPSFVLARRATSAVQVEATGRPANDPLPQTPAVPHSKPMTEHAPAPLRAHPFLEQPIPGEDDIVQSMTGPTTSDASKKMLRICLRIWAMLDEKNRAYGNSALDPVRVFSKASLGEQIRVRLDDKISRLARGQAAGEDVVQDLMGYLVLLKVSELSWPTER